jgi:hypothetical protein
LQIQKRARICCSVTGGKRQATCLLSSAAFGHLPDTSHGHLLLRRVTGKLLHAIRSLLGRPLNPRATIMPSFPSSTPPSPSCVSDSPAKHRATARLFLKLIVRPCLPLPHAPLELACTTLFRLARSHDIVISLAVRHHCLTVAVVEHHSWSLSFNHLPRWSHDELLNLVVPTVDHLSCCRRRSKCHRRALLCSTAAHVARLITSSNSTNQQDRSARRGSVML